MAMPILNPVNTGAITSNTLNLTRITSMLAVVVGSITTVSGAAAQPADSGTEEIDWAGFNQNQRVVLLVALIAAVAIVHAADLLARSSIATAAGSAGVILLLAPKPAILNTPGSGIGGQVIATRLDGKFLFRRNDNGELLWSGQVTIP